jgi:ClpP class serine protease
MIKHPRFTRRLMGTPHLIAPPAARAVLGYLLPGARLTGGMPAAWDDEPMNMPDPRSFQLIGSCAVIPIVGELVHRGGSMDAMSGVTSYQALADMTADALDDTTVSSICFDIDSGGGEGPGCLDFASWLASKRGKKPMCACINQVACSAAYAIASAADHICIGEDGLAGSIGVLAFHTDLSAAMGQAGIAIEFVFAGERKIDGNPAQPLSDPARTSLQDMVDAMYARFCAVVADNRGMTPEAVAGTEAACFRGRAAVTAGLADSVATLEDSVMSMNSRAAAPGSRMRASAAKLGPGPTGMDAAPAPPATPLDAVLGAETIAGPAPAYPDCPTPSDCQCAADGEAPPGEACPHAKPKQAASVSAAAPEALADACAMAGLPELTAPLLRARASMPEVQARIADASAIIEAARRSGQPGMARALVQSGVCLEHARDLLFAARSEGADATRINTARAAEGGAPPPPDVATIYQTYNSRGARRS